MIKPRPPIVFNGVALEVVCVKCGGSGAHGTQWFPLLGKFPAECPECSGSGCSITQAGQDLCTFMITQVGASDINGLYFKRR